MKLEEIGFYTLEDYRAKNVSVQSPLWRCELILTDACNFRCPYCRGLNSEIKGTLSFNKAKSIVELWSYHHLKNIRFSGGEPTLYPELFSLVEFAKDCGVKRIAVSTNGSANINYYKHLIKCGVNDFSISLDSCCSSMGDKMSGGILGSWKRVTENIKELSKICYVTVGIVLTEENVSECIEIIKFADLLGVHDIRVIPSAQFNNKLLAEIQIVANTSIFSKYPILKYRINNIQQGKSVRGIQLSDTNKCPLVLDDMAVAGDYHFPCIIYMREKGKPIGKMNKNLRQDRLEFFSMHNTHLDMICKNNCLDVCTDYNNKAMMYLTGRSNHV